MKFSNSWGKEDKKPVKAMALPRKPVDVQKELSKMSGGTTDKTQEQAIGGSK